MSTLKRLGSTNCQVSSIGLGLNIGGDQARQVDYPSLLRVLEKGFELGINFFDTAPVYGSGESEKVLGQFCQGKRDRVVVATKIGAADLQTERVIQSVEASLKRLNTDYIDLLQIHWPNPTIPLEDTARGLDQLIRAGKIKYLGVSNFTSKELETLSSALKPHQIVSIQQEYNLFDRTAELEVLPNCKKNQQTLIAYSPLHRGHLTNGANQKKIIQKLADQHQCTLAQVVLSWIVSKAPIIAIPATTRIEGIVENAGAMEVRLSPEEIAEIDRNCQTEIAQVSADQIQVVSSWSHKAYRTLEEAKSNALNMVPSPAEVAEQIKSGEFLKPVRLKRVKDPDAKYPFDLVEGRTRYWAWVIANGNNVPVPSLIDESG